ncbi:DNA-binding WRKY [Macleaya cordata]|uniref:DNA-binding WRKY n=1 Tax=Macleaya cordata TaxID=56857 RepID=A0A200QHL9_MACCD|nr:DNA-binding WRKY [Macleaya cordata]
MEVNDAWRIVVAKPVASKPSCSHFSSLSELLADSINVSPPSAISGTAVVAIRPKTVRLKPVVNCTSDGVVSSQGEMSGTAVCCLSDEVLKSGVKSTVVYKPLAKLVSKTTGSLLRNLGSFDTRHQETLLQVEVQQPENFHLKSPLIVEKSQKSEPSTMGSQNLEHNQRVLPPTTSKGRLASDGYNWRKYGQKQVKGSECPRSYYKCTQAKCAVKKMVERSFDGNIAEIVYKGDHNHPKPQRPEPLSSGAQEQGFRFNGTCEETGIPLRNTSFHERNEGSEGRIENQNEVGVLVNPNYPGKALIPHISVTAGTFNNGVGLLGNYSRGSSGVFADGSRRVDAEDDEPKCKRSKIDYQSHEVGIAGLGVKEPPSMVQSSTDSEVLRDGFRWRKYGQKVVKGNPYPRSYYRCASLKCTVRKHVERALDDPRAFITTYEGVHNHEMPIIKRQNSVASSNTDSVAPTNKAKQ